MMLGSTGAWGTASTSMGGFGTGPLYDMSLIDQPYCLVFNTCVSMWGHHLTIVHHFVSDNTSAWGVGSSSAGMDHLARGCS